MKNQTIYHTPVGKFYSRIRDDTDEQARKRFDQYDALCNKQRDSDDCNNGEGYVLVTKDDTTIFIPNSVLKNSVIEYYCCYDEEPKEESK